MTVMVMLTALSVPSPGASAYVGDNARDAAPERSSQSFADGGSCRFTQVISAGTNSWFWAKPWLECSNLTTTLHATVTQSISTLKYSTLQTGETQPASVSCTITGTATCHGPYFEGWGELFAVLRAHSSFVMSYPLSAENSVVSPWCSMAAGAGVNGWIRYRCYANANETTPACVATICRKPPTAARARTRR